MTTTETHVLKFGGSSLKNAVLIKQSAQIVVERSKRNRPVVVVSAMDGVTDKLIELADKAATKTPLDWSRQLSKLRQQHLHILNQLIVEDHKESDQINLLFEELANTLKTLRTSIDDKRPLIDHVLSVGERASALIFAAHLNEQGLQAKSYEAHHFIKTDSTFGQAIVQPDATRTLIREYLPQNNTVAVITGFIGSDTENRITTLGRSGSDYTAGLLAEALNADHLEIWTDVDGVLSADPRWVSAPEPIEALSFGDITELSAHGANIIHPQTIEPISDKATTVLVKNSFNPSHPGTSITSSYNSNGALKTITITGPFVRLQVDESFGYELLGKLKEWLDGEPDTETIGFERTSKYEPARFLLTQPFFESISNRLARWAADHTTIFDLEDKLYKVKKFSNAFTNDETLTKRIWGLLTSNNLQPVESHRNCDKRFISFLFKEKDARRGAQLINDYLQFDHPVVDLFIAGTGAVGKRLLQQLNTLSSDDIHIRLLGACNSRKALWKETGFRLQEDLDWSNSEPTDWSNLLTKLTDSQRQNIIFVDATGSEEVAQLYPSLLKENVHIVTPSKLANTFEQAYFDELQELTHKHNASFRYETTVGAGLPVLSTIRSLQESGDKVTEISGVVSGTMTYLFDQLENGVSFSKAIIKARDLGYAEPDPRDDLSGEDVARKFLTLARILGLKIERDELQVESLIPDELRSASRDKFLQELSNFDRSWQQRIRTARNRNEVLRYTGRLKDGSIEIGIESVAKDSPLGQLQGTDNLIQITSRFYNQSPLVIQGPGAGKEVTAAGVLSDICKTAQAMS